MRRGSGGRREEEDKEQELLSPRSESPWTTLSHVGSEAVAKV